MKICQRAKLKPSVQRPEEIVLMTRQNVSRLQAFERGVQSCARIRQCHAQDRKIYMFLRRWLRWCSSGVHINALAIHFDQKCKRFAANPVRGALWRPRLRMRVTEWHFAEQAIVGRGQYVNVPWPDSARVPGRHRISGRCARAFGKLDTGCGRDQTPLCLCHYNRDIEQVIEMSVRHQNGVCFWRESAQSIIDARDVRLNPRTKGYAQKIHAREVRIHE